MGFLGVSFNLWAEFNLDSDPGNILNKQGLVNGDLIITVLKGKGIRTGIQNTQLGKDYRE